MKTKLLSNLSIYFHFTMFSCKSKSMNSAFILEAEVLTSSGNALESKLYDRIKSWLYLLSFWKCICYTDQIFDWILSWNWRSNGQSLVFMLGHLKLMIGPSDWVSHICVKTANCLGQSKTLGCQAFSHSKTCQLEFTISFVQNIFFSICT